MNPLFSFLASVMLAGMILLPSNSASAIANDTNVVVFTHASIIPLDRDEVLYDRTVIVRNGRIALIGASASTEPPIDCTVIDATGKFLLPGMTDMHVHVQEPEDLTSWLAYGITTILNLNGRPTHLEWKKKLASGAMEGPNLNTAGPTIYSANTKRDGDSLVEAYHRAGYDCIKIYNDVTSEGYRGIIETARKYDMLTVGHIPRAPGYQGVLEAHQAIAHAEEYM